MHDIGPSWSEETISYMIGKSPQSSDTFRVEFLESSNTNTTSDTNNNNNNTKTARLYFGSNDDMHKTIAAYQGLEIPNTHRYHHYSFSTEDGEQNIQHTEATTPPLHLQLMALQTKVLERRLNNISSHYTSTTAHSKTHKGNRICKVHKHASLAYHLAQAMRNDRITNHCNGVLVPDGFTNELLQYLRTSADTLWPPEEKKRKSVSSGEYMTVRTNHPPEYDKVWQLCEQLIRQVIPDAVYNALAITKSFRGSPHIDNHDKTFQHVIALGDFKGGYLCTEADEDGNEVVEVDVKNKFGRIDGRSVHWVSGWTGERYSIVYYSTSDDDYTEQLPQRVHTRWMQKKSGIVPERSYAPNNLRLPNTTPILGLGCSSFSTFFSSREEDDVTPLTVDNMSRNHPAVIEWIETIQHAVLNRGIFLLDTAPWYGHGISEVTVGYALDTLLLEDVEQVNEQSSRRIRTGFLPRSSLIVNTKVGRYEADPLLQFDFTYDTTIRSVQRSLERMNCSYIDVIQLHDPEFAPSISLLIEETIPALLECRKRGLAKAIGITGYPLDVQHQILVECQTTFGGVVFDQSLVYCHNNLHDMSLFDDSCVPSLNEERLDEKDDKEKDSTITFAQYCQQSNIYLMAAAPLSMGLLTNNKPPNWHPASPLLKEACSAAAKLCESKGVNISSIALLYSLSQEDTSCTLLGMRNVKEVDAAADLAMRFYIDSVDEENTNKGSTSSGCNNRLLDEILSPKEKAILEMLLDKTLHGPFSSVISSGQYRWDGKEEANKFRKMVEEMKRNRANN